MKRPFRLLSMALLVATVFCFVSKPETAEAKNWTWTKYRLKMWLPNAMRPTANTNAYFIAKGHGIVLKVKPWKSRSTTSRQAAMYGYRTYGIIQRKRIVFQKRVKKWGAWVHTIIGSGTAQGRPAFFAVIGLSSRRSVNNFYVRMWWRPRNHLWAKPKVLKIARRLHVY